MAVSLNYSILAHKPRKKLIKLLELWQGNWYIELWLTMIQWLSLNSNMGFFSPSITLILHVKVDRKKLKVDHWELKKEKSLAGTKGELISFEN